MISASIPEKSLRASTHIIAQERKKPCFYTHAGYASVDKYTVYEDFSDVLDEISHLKSGSYYSPPTTDQRRQKRQKKP